MSAFAIPQAWAPRNMPWLEDDRIAAGIPERESRISTRKLVRALSKRDGVPMPRHVYFVGATGTELIKIGSAFDIELRLEQLRTISPLPLNLLFYVLHGGETMERRLHKMYRRRRSHGEWYRVDVAELQAATDALIAEARAAKKARPK